MAVARSNSSEPGEPMISEDPKHAKGKAVRLFSPQLALVVCDIAGLSGSLWLAYQLRFDFAVPPESRQTFPLIFAWVIAFKIFCLWRFRRFEVLLGYFNISEASRLFWALFVPSLFIFGVSNQFGANFAPPRSVVLIDLGFSIIGLTAVRLGFRPE